MQLFDQFSRVMKAEFFDLVDYYVCCLLFLEGLIVFVQLVRCAEFCIFLPWLELPVYKASFRIFGRTMPNTKNARE